MRQRTLWYMMFAMFWWECFFGPWFLITAFARQNLGYGAFGVLLIALAVWNFTVLAEPSDVRNLGLIKAFKVGLAEARYSDIHWFIITYNIVRIELDLWNPEFYFRDNPEEPFPLSSLDHSSKMYKDARKMFGYIR